MPPRTYKATPLTAGARPGGPKTRSRPPSRTPLAVWLASCDMTTREVADALGVTAPYLYKLRDGDRVPGRDIAVQIETLTGGRVPADGWPRTTRAKGTT